MKQWLDASLESNAALEQERSRREELETRVQALERQLEQQHSEQEVVMQKQQEKHRKVVDSLEQTAVELHNKLLSEEAKREEAVQKERSLEATFKRDPASLIFKALGARRLRSCPLQDALRVCLSLGDLSLTLCGCCAVPVGVQM